MSRVYAVVLLAALALAALPAAAAPPAAAPAPLDREFLGMVIRDPWYDFGTNPAYPNQPNRAFQDTMGAILKRTGVRWVRLDFHIPVPIGGATGVISDEIMKNDYFINEVAPRNDLKVLALLSFDLVQGIDPRQLNCETTQCLVSGSRFGGGVNAYMDAWLTRALMIADHYRDKIAAYEVLNEQNRLPQYTPNGPAGDGIAPQITARLLTKFYRFCKNIDPAGENHGCRQEGVYDSPIVMGGLHPRGTSDVSNPSVIVMSDTQYLSATYAISQTNSPFISFKNTYEPHVYPVDGIGYHPYPEEIVPSLADTRINSRMPRMRQMLVDLGDGSKQFWITEVGFNVAYFRAGGPAAEANQAAFMRDVYTSLYARGDVANVFWFKYEDFPPASGSNAQKWGIVRIPFVDGSCPGGACYDVNGTPSVYRLSYLTYRELAGLPVYRAFGPLIRR